MRKKLLLEMENHVWRFILSLSICYENGQKCSSTISKFVLEKTYLAVGKLENYSVIFYTYYMNFR